MNNLSLPATRKPTGLIESAMQKLFTRSAQVLKIDDIGKCYRIITLGGEALRDVAWTPGDKIQIQLGGWVQRTYTPMDWDAENGRTRVLVHLHADGPGTQWARGLSKGDPCVVFGPRKSVRLARPQAPVILFGDETSLGLAAALSSQVAAPALQVLLEVSTPADTLRALRLLQLDDAHVCLRLDQDRHIAGLKTLMSTLLDGHPTSEIVLTGKAGSMQHMSRLLRERNIAAGRRQSKAYWAPGKTGMD